MQLYALPVNRKQHGKEGKIIFRNTPLEEGLRMLEKRYNVEFIIKNDRLKGDSFTGTFTKSTSGTYLRVFPTFLPDSLAVSLILRNIKDEKK